MYSIEIKFEDLQVLVLTNAGTFTQVVSADGKSTTLSTAEKAVASAWIEQLRAAGRVPLRSAI